MANTTASPSGVNRNFAGPSRKTTDVNTQLIASVETIVGTAMPAEPCSVAAARVMPSLRSRWVFSIVTVESSTRIPTASAMRSADFITDTSEFEFSAHKGSGGARSACLTVTDRDRAALQGRIFALLDARVKGVHINMDDLPRIGSAHSEDMLAGRKERRRAPAPKR